MLARSYPSNLGILCLSSIGTDYVYGGFVYRHEPSTGFTEGFKLSREGNGAVYPGLRIGGLLGIVAT